MKLLRAEFQNFRILRDLELEFSTDSSRKLTVVRAANETGKTTILNALQWAFYGDEALPAKGHDYRLHPIDWPTSNSKVIVPITVTVDFEVVNVHMGRGKPRETRKQYRLVRTTREEIDGTNSRRDESSLKLYDLTEKGADPLESPESRVHDELPPELRDVFFTDGDRALSFIEADVSASTKRERVSRAIRSLLGLGVIESAISHVSKCSVDFNKTAKQIGAGTKLAEVAALLEATADAISKTESEYRDAKEQAEAFEEKLDQLNKKINSVLQKGDREKLQRELGDARRQVSAVEAQLSDLSSEHSRLFRSETLARDLLLETLAPALSRLQDMRSQGKIPNSTIPVLEDRLSHATCFCGESLDENHDHGKKRRTHLEDVINRSRKADAVQQVVTDLYFNSKNILATHVNNSTSWLELYKKIVTDRERAEAAREREGKKLAALELQLDGIPDTDIKELRATQKEYKEQRERFFKKQVQADAQLSGLREKDRALTIERNKLLKDQNLGAQVRCDLDVANDVVEILKRSYEQMNHEELEKVSALMNEIFLNMIGSDPNQGAIIKSAEITRDFDIVVTGPEGRTLNPDRDLNGASRRALTVAFILALTKVSDVDAPNVIDTPLGMTSDYVKRSILYSAIKHSTQLILFLTPSEIAGCEDIIDQAAGMVVTLTNPAHFPKILVNNPNIVERKVLLCTCDHRHACKLCMRRAAAEIQLEMAS